MRITAPIDRRANRAGHRARAGRRTWTLAISAVGLLCLTAVRLTASSPPDVDTRHVAHVAGLDADDLQQLGAGRIVVRTLDGADSREVAVLGAVTLPVPRETVLDSLRDVVSFKRRAEVPQIGRFAARPSIHDLAGLTLDESDLEDLRECSRSRCKLHLPSEMVDAIEARREASAGGTSDEHLSALFKRFLVRRVSDYVAGGPQALPPYAQRAAVSQPAEDIADLLAASAPYAELAPAVFERLRTFPRRDAQNVEEALYWAKEQFGWKPVITVTHRVIGPTGAEPGASTVAASLQLYASHYLDASLGVTLVVDAPRTIAPAGSSLLIYVNRSRVKATTGFWGGMVRRMIESRGRDALRRHLDELRSGSSRWRP